MRNLLSADFSRLKKDKFFWLSVAAMLIFTVCIIVKRYSPTTNYFHWSHYYFDAVLVFPLICSLFISLYVCKDLDNKTIRNKAIAGYSKTSIYLSYLVTNFAGATLIYIAMLIGGLVAIPLFGAPEPSEYNVAAYIIIGFFAVLSTASAYTFVSIIASSRVKALVASIIVFFAVYFIIIVLVYDPLSNSEFFDHHYIEINGEWIEVEGTMPNPKYVGGAMRTVLECVMEFFPIGNAVLLLSNMIVNPIREIVLSLLFTVTTSVCGIFAFRKKDMK